MVIRIWEKKIRRKSQKGGVLQKEGLGIESLIMIIIKLINLQIVGWTVDLLPEKLSWTRICPTLNHSTKHFLLTFSLIISFFSWFLITLFNLFDWKWSLEWPNYPRRRRMVFELKFLQPKSNIHRIYNQTDRKTYIRYQKGSICLAGLKVLKGYLT